MKLLSPAGDFESLKMAVFYGADEVYLGVKDFNARNNIAGFDLASLKEAVDFAHIFGVRVHLTVNILFRDEEMGDALDLVVHAYNWGVDAFIVQDVGLASLIHEFYPEIEMHASTQMGIHNLEGVLALQKLGFKRVVLSRETPLSEIRRIKDNTDVEIEYFAQGALCVSFSGNCYLSSYLCGASGNRGKCKQLCRLPYTFEKNGKVLKQGFLLSAKDFNMIEKLDELAEAGVDAIKIEGRARRPFYVAIATKEYRSALDKKDFNLENLELAFNRNYTAGYFDGNGNIISKFQSHIGIFVGEVEKSVFGKRFNEIFVKSKRNLNKKSTFKIFENGEEKCTLTAFDLQKVGGDLYRITTTQKVNKGARVHLIIDNDLEEKILAKVVRKSVKIDIFAKENEKIKAVVSCGNIRFEIFGAICKTAKNQPISEQDMEKNFQKSEFFDAKLNCVLGNVFLTKQELNEFRRNVFERLKSEIVSIFEHNLGEKSIIFDGFGDIETLKNIQIVENENEKIFGENIIYSPEIYDEKVILALKQKCEDLGKNFYLDTPNFALAEDVTFLENMVKKLKISIVANNPYALTFDTEIVAGGGLNVFNHKTAKFFGKKCLTAESDIATRVVAPYMTLRHCPMKTNLGCSCKNCPYEEGFAFRMQNGKLLRLKRKKMSSCTFYLTD